MHTQGLRKPPRVLPEQLRGRLSRWGGGGEWRFMREPKIQLFSRLCEQKARLICSLKWLGNWSPFYPHTSPSLYWKARIWEESNEPSHCSAPQRPSLKKSNSSHGHDGVAFIWLSPVTFWLAKMWVIWNHNSVYPAMSSLAFFHNMLLLMTSRSFRDVHAGTCSHSHSALLALPVPRPQLPPLAGVPLVGVIKGD